MPSGLCNNCNSVITLAICFVSSVVRLFASVTAGSGLGRAEGAAEGAADPYERTMKYLESHNNILQIFQEITARLVYDRPDDPLRFMVEQLQKMIESREERNKAE